MEIHDALNSIAETRRSEVDQETNGKIQKPQISEYLFSVYTRELLGGFQLDQNSALDEQIGTERLFESHSLELEGDRLLPFDSQPTLLEHSGEYLFINGFEQPRPYPGVDVVRRIDNLAGDFVGLKHGRSWRMGG
jgi:hypothetical protein